MFTRKQLQARRKSWKAKTKYSGERSLLVLPCNSGGPIGSYFKGNNGHNLWTHCSYYLREWRRDLVFMAVDNAACWMPGRMDGLGAGEFEWEVSRATSAFDAGIPTAGRFDAAKMELFVESLRTLCKRIQDYGFEKVWVILTPLAYRTAFMRAAELEELTVALFSAARCGVANVAAQLMRCLLLSHEKWNESVLITHEGLKNVPLPKTPEKWGIEDPVAKLSVRHWTVLTRAVQGKYGKYYMNYADWANKRCPTPQALSEHYLVPEEEDFRIFK